MKSRIESSLSQFEVIAEKVNQAVLVSLIKETKANLFDSSFNQFHYQVFMQTHDSFSDLFQQNNIQSTIQHLFFAFEDEPQILEYRSPYMDRLIEELLSFFREKTIQELPRQTAVQIVFVLYLIRNRVDESLINNIISNFSEPLKKISFLLISQFSVRQIIIEILHMHISSIEKKIAVAEFVNLFKVSLVDIIDLVDVQLIAPFLRHADLTNLHTAKNELYCTHLINKLNNSQIFSFFSNLPHLYRLPAFKYCLNLRLSCTKEIIEIPSSMFKLRSLVLNNCSVAQLPRLEYLVTLNINRNNSIEMVANLPRLKELICCNCEKLQEIKDLPLCTSINIDSLPNLKTIFNIPLCRELKAQNCRSLQSIQLLPCLVTLDINNCLDLRLLPAVLHDAQQLSLPDGYNLHVLPEVTQIASIIFPRNRIELLVSFEDLKNNPYGCFARFFRALLSTNLMPTIKFTSQTLGLSWAVDLGGVKRHFIDLLFSWCFLQQESSDSCFILEQGIVLLKNGMNFHSIHPGDFSFLVQSMGKLLAYSLLKDNDHRLMGTFSENFLKLVIKSDLSSLINSSHTLDANQEQIALQALATLKGWEKIMKITQKNSSATLLPVDFLMIYSSLSTPDLSEDLLEQLDKFYHQCYEENSHFIDLLKNNNVFPLSKNQHEFLLFIDQKILPQLDLVAIRTDLQKIATSYMPTFLFAAHISREAQSLMGEYEWMILKELSMEEIMERVSLAITSQNLLNQIHFVSTLSQEQEELFKRSEIFMQNWIKNADEALLIQILQATTGTKYPGQKKIIVQISNRIVKMVPSAHTCFYTLEIGADYENQEEFNQKMQIFLDHALLECGFSDF